MEYFNVMNSIIVCCDNNFRHLSNSWRNLERVYKTVEWNLTYDITIDQLVDYLIDSHHYEMTKPQI